MIRETTDWAIARSHDDSPLITFAGRDLAIEHWKKIGSPDSLLVVKRKITVQVVKEYIRPSLRVVKEEAA